jgi:hypothetical protein
MPTGADTAAGAMAPPAFDPHLLFTSCASPFATLPHKSIVLKNAPDASPQIVVKADWAEKDGDLAAHWTVKNDKDEVLAIVELAPAQPATELSVMVFDKDHKPLADAYTCGTVAKDAPVPLLKDGAPYATLSSTLTPDASALDAIVVAGQTLKPQE